MGWWREWGPAVVVVVLAVAVRVQGLGETSLSSEEIHAVGAARALGDDFLPEVRALPGAAPLYFGLLRLVSAYGLEEWRLRALSALCGAAGVAALMLLARRLSDRRAALIAGVLLAVSPLHVSYSRQARPYALFVLLAVVLLALLWDVARGGRRTLAAAAVATLAAYTHYYTLLILGAAAVIALPRAWSSPGARQGSLRVCAAAASAAILFAPWAAYDLPAGIGRQLVHSGVGWGTAGVLARAFAAGDAGSAGTPWAVGFTVLAVAGIVGAALRRPSAALFLGVIIIAGTSGALALAHYAPYVFAPAQVLFVLPPFLLLVGEGIGRLADLVPAAARGPVAAALTMAAAGGALSPAEPRLMARQADWRAAADVVLENLDRDDAVVAPLAHRQLLFYAPELERRLGGDARLRAARARLRRARRAWVVAPGAAWLSREWAGIEAALRWRVVVDLSPAFEPKVYFATYETGRPVTYLYACHFDLPVATLARQEIVRDCLLYVGPKAGPMAMIERLVLAPKAMPPRNASLLEAVTLLVESGYFEHAYALASAIAGAEPAWLEARQAVVAVEEIWNQEGKK